MQSLIWLLINGSMYYIVMNKQTKFDDRKILTSLKTDYIFFVIYHF